VAHGTTSSPFSWKHSTPPEMPFEPLGNGAHSRVPSVGAPGPREAGPQALHQVSQWHLVGGALTETIADISGARQLTEDRLRDPGCSPTASPTARSTGLAGPIPSRARWASSAEARNRVSISTSSLPR
jgi:hypothetical protein